MAKSKLVEVNKKIEKAVVGGYKAIENGVVVGFKKMSDEFVDQFLTREGESVEDAKARLAKEQEGRSAANTEMNQEKVDYAQAGLAHAKEATENARKTAGLN